MSHQQKFGRIVILGAMQEEIEAYQEHIKDGKWKGKTVYVELTGVGKPAAAATTQKSICEYRPDAIIFTGAGGALDPNLAIGDVGIGIASIDADLDVRAWDSKYKRGEQPFTHERIYYSHPDLVRLALESPSPNKKFEAYIASGSEFMDTKKKRDFMNCVLPDLSAVINGRERMPNVVEMEGSAVLQVAKMNNIPCLAIRAVSDTTKGDAPADFNKFVKESIKDYVKIVDYVIEKA